MSEIATVINQLRSHIQDRHVEAVLDDLEELLVRKGADYSGEDDTYNNFRFVATVFGDSVEGQILRLVTHKVGRAVNTMQRDPEALNFESSWDSWKDLLGYLVLLLAYQKAKE